MDDRILCVLIGVLLGYLLQWKECSMDKACGRWVKMWMSDTLWLHCGQLPSPALTNMEGMLDG